MKNNFELLKLEIPLMEQVKTVFGSEDRSRHTPWHWASKSVADSIPEGGIVLDIASGYGNPYVINAIRDKKCKADFVDVLPPVGVLNFDDIKYHYCDLEKEDIPLNSQYDCIVSVSSFEHLTKQSRLRVCKWIKEHLKPGGFTAFSMGFFTGISNMEKVMYSFENMTFFSDRNCMCYLPIDIEGILECFNIESNSISNITEKLLNIHVKDNKVWFGQSEICSESFSDYEELRKIPWMKTIFATELLLIIKKN